MDNEFHGLKFGIDRSVRYHERRLNFFRRTDFLVNTLSLIGSSAAVTSLLAWDPGLPLLMVFASLVAVLSYINLIMRSAEMAALHANLRQRFFVLQISLLEISSEETPTAEDRKLIKSIHRERLLIEKDEPPPFRILDLMCHNELCLAQGANPDDPGICDHLYHIPWYRSLTANVLRGESNHVRTEAAHRNQKGWFKRIFRG